MWRRRVGFDHAEGVILSGALQKAGLFHGGISGEARFSAGAEGASALQKAQISQAKGQNVSSIRRLGIGWRMVAVSFSGFPGNGRPVFVLLKRKRYWEEKQNDGSNL